VIINMWLLTLAHRRMARYFLRPKMYKIIKRASPVYQPTCDLRDIECPCVVPNSNNVTLYRIVYSYSLWFNYKWSLTARNSVNFLILRSYELQINICELIILSKIEFAFVRTVSLIKQINWQRM